VYAACVAALETHTLNLAAELAGTGVTVNALRAQRICISLRAWLKTIDHDQIEDPLIRRFVHSQIDVDVIDSVGPARALLTQVLGTESGHIWDTLHPDPCSSPIRLGLTAGRTVTGRTGRFGTKRPTST
jgi:NAD(P)-dependent dehydrogenase (short-subunit alcohol dehydrogenase family)